MQFPNEIVSQLIIVDNAGNKVIQIGPGPTEVIRGAMGSIVMDATGGGTGNPTIYFYNDNASNFGFINLGRHTHPQADIGITSGSYQGSFYPALTEASRIFFASPGSTSVIGNERTDTQAQVGGGMIWTDSEVAIQVNNATGSTIGQLLLQQVNAPGGADNINAFLTAGTIADPNTITHTEATTFFPKYITRNNQQCKVQFDAAGFTIAANVDTYAQGGWSELTSTGWFSIVGGFSQVVVPYGTYYDIEVRGNFGINASQTGASFATMNARAIGNSIARFAMNGISAGGDGQWVTARRHVFLPAGTVVYWGQWCNASVTCNATVINIPSAFEIRTAG